MTKPTIGFIGLGLMGSAMVECLQSKGYQLTVLGNRNRTGLDAAVAKGATEATTAKELAQASDVIMLCVGTSDQVESRMRGDDGIIAGLSKEAIVVDFGTSLPQSTRALAEEVAKAGGSFLDAPLGRTPAHAKDGLLNIMCAGDENAFNKVQPVLQDLGENVFFLGASGSGHTIKLINNAFGMTVANAMAEAFVIADGAGVDRQSVYDVMAAGPLHSGMMDFVSAYALKGDASQLAFSIGNATKDVGYYFEMANANKTEPRIPAGTLSALTDATNAGQGDNMVSQMVDFYDKKKG